MSGWDEGEAWILASEEGYSIREFTVPSAEDEYLASLEPEEPSLTAELILALSTLTAKQRFVIECRYGFRNDGVGMTERDIAPLMGISQQGVHKLLNRALDALRRGLSSIPTGGSLTRTGEVRSNVLRMDQSRVLEEPLE